MILSLARRAMQHRPLTTGLAVLSVALSVMLLLGVEKVRVGARESFRQTISQTDLIVGARSGPVPLLLYSIFHMGSPTANVSYERFQFWTQHPAVAWTIPLSLGDSHRGFRVVGTSPQLFERYRYRGDKGLEFAEGRPFSAVPDAVIGADVAARLRYQVGTSLTLSHGVSDDGVSFQDHENEQFSVVGVLRKTGTPLDRSVLVSLAALEWLHVGWEDGAPPASSGHSAEHAGDITPEDLPEPETLTAFLLGAKSRLDTLGLMREINDDTSEPMLAVIPGVALDELWAGIDYAEAALRVVALFVVLVGLTGMLIAIYNTLSERRREMAILRSLGAGPLMIAGLFLAEALTVTCSGLALGMGLLYGGLQLGQGWIEREFGLYLSIAAPGVGEWTYILLVAVAGVAMGIVPAWRAYRLTLSDGLAVRT